LGFNVVPLELCHVSSVKMIPPQMCNDLDLVIMLEKTPLICKGMCACTYSLVLLSKSLSIRENLDSTEGH